MLLRLWEIVPLLPRYGNFRKSRGTKRKKPYVILRKLIKYIRSVSVFCAFTYALIETIAFSLGLWGLITFYSFNFLEALSDYLQEIALEAPKTPFFFYHLPSISNVYGIYIFTNRLSFKNFRIY